MQAVTADIAMPTNSFRALLPSLPDEPYHPHKAFPTPGEALENKTCPMLSTEQVVWPFLHYDEGQDVVFCHTCVKAFKTWHSNNAASAIRSYQTIPPFQTILTCSDHQRFLQLERCNCYFQKTCLVQMSCTSGWSCCDPAKDNKRHWRAT